MCAVGRCMTDEAITQNAWNAQTADELEDLDSLLQPKYQGHSIGFWKELQEMHDFGSNWDKQGMNDQGKRLVQDLLAKYKD